MSLGYYGDGGSMRSSGIDDRDIRWSFICEYCEHDNDDLDAVTDGISIWSHCEKCVMPNSGSMGN